MTENRPRIIGALVGDINHTLGAQTKYKALFQAIQDRYKLVDVYDATLRGFDRWLNAIRVVHPNRRHWRERFHKNVPAFQLRSKRFETYLQNHHNQADLIFQVGVLFNPARHSTAVPFVTYTDYTAQLSAKRPKAGRSPFTEQQRQQWIALEGQVYDRAEHIFTRSQFVGASLADDYGINADKITVVGGGVNFDKLPKLDAMPNGNQMTILFIGKDFYRKGGDILLRAFAQARLHAENARLILVTDDDIPSDLPLEGVTVMAPTWDRAKIGSLYQQADIFVLPSRLETWGDVLLEAMAYGLPCIGVTGDSMPEIIDNGRTGLIVQRENVAALAQALSSLLCDQATRLRYGAAGRKRVESLYTWKAVVARMAPVIESTGLLYGDRATRNAS